MSAMQARRRIVAMAVAVSMVAGCAVTPPRWTTPDPKEVHEQTMPYAQAYARSAMRAYQSAVDGEVVASTRLGSGLIGLAGVITALAAYGAHKDALIGGALLGGTAYAIGNWNLSKQRQLVYLAGAEAVNCALTAVNAFNMSEADRIGLNDALADLERSLGEVTGGIDVGQRAEQHDKHFLDQLSGIGRLQSRLGRPVVEQRCVQIDEPLPSLVVAGLAESQQ